ncbi:MAG TPA: hypothetical protein VG223_16645 [Solirubrobacteraceae bacterium]|nr:hypothetical protein [Solirubrobacteraceae bacterium]
MKRSLMVAAALACIAALAPAAASAQTVELGQSTSAPLVAPSCPSSVTPTNCTIVLTRSTALQTIRDSVDYPTIAKANGEIVAFTVGLSRLSTSLTTAHAEVSNLDHAYGGTTQVAVAILKPVPPHKKFQWQLVAVGPVTHVQPYLGTVTQFPLSTPLPILKGEAVALSVPTWAPILSIGLTTADYAYRQDRSASCGVAAATEQAMFTLSATSAFGCDYTGVSPQYSATEITTPVPPKVQVKTSRHRATAARVVELGG